MTLPQPCSPSARYLYEATRAATTARTGTSVGAA